MFETIGKLYRPLRATAGAQCAKSATAAVPQMLVEHLPGRPANIHSRRNNNNRPIRTVHGADPARRALVSVVRIVRHRQLSPKPLKIDIFTPVLGILLGDLRPTKILHGHPHTLPQPPQMHDQPHYITIPNHNHKNSLTTQKQPQKTTSQQPQKQPHNNSLTKSQPPPSTTNSPNKPASTPSTQEPTTGRSSVAEKSTGSTAPKTHTRTSCPETTRSPEWRP